MKFLLLLLLPFTAFGVTKYNNLMVDNLVFNNTTNYSKAMELSSVGTYSIQLKYSGSSLAGTVTPQVTNVSSNGQCSTTLADYVDLTSLAHTITAGGDNIIFNVTGAGYQCVRLKMVSSNANNITVNAYFTGKR